MDSDVYMAVAARAHGHCEHCNGSGAPFPLELDHFFGRAKVEEQEYNCWLLCRACHTAKTNARPHMAHWLLAFVEHCRRWARPAGLENWEKDGYRLAAKKAEDKLAWLRAKGTSGEAA